MVELRGRVKVTQVREKKVRVAGDRYRKHFINRQFRQFVVDRSDFQRAAPVTSGVNAQFGDVTEFSHYHASRNDDDGHTDLDDPKTEKKRTATRASRNVALRSKEFLLSSLR